MRVNSFGYRIEDKEIYAMVDNLTNHVWSFDDTFAEAKKALDRYPDRSNYRIEKVKARDYFDLQTGRLKKNRIKKSEIPSIIDSLIEKVDQASNTIGSGEQINNEEQIL